MPPAPVDETPVKLWHRAITSGFGSEILVGSYRVWRFSSWFGSGIEMSMSILLNRICVWKAGWVVLDFSFLTFYISDFAYIVELKISICEHNILWILNILFFYQMVYSYKNTNWDTSKNKKIIQKFLHLYLIRITSEWNFGLESQSDQNFFLLFCKYST